MPGGTLGGHKNLAGGAGHGQGTATLSPETPRTVGGCTEARRPCAEARTGGFHARHGLQPGGAGPRPSAADAPHQPRTSGAMRTSALAQQGHGSSSRPQRSRLGSGCCSGSGPGTAAAAPPPAGRAPEPTLTLEGGPPPLPACRGLRRQPGSPAASGTVRPGATSARGVGSE